MNHRTMLAAVAVSAAFAAMGPDPAVAQDPIVFGVIAPLSPPGETALGQLVKRGAELGAEYLNEKGGVLGRKVTVSVQDSAGKNEQGVAAYRRLVSQEKAVAVFGFVHSGVNIAVNEVAKEIGVPTMGTQTGAGDVTGKHYPIAFRTHAVDPPRVATWMGWIKKNNWKRVAILAETTDYGIGLANETEKQAKAAGAGIETLKIMFDRTTTDLLPQLLQVKAFKPDVIVNIGVGQPLELMITQANTVGLLPDVKMVTSYDAPARPQFWQIHGDKWKGVSFIAFYSPKSELSEPGKWLAEEVPGEVQRAAGLWRAQRVRQRTRIRAGDREGEVDRSQGDDRRARGRLVHRLVGGAGHLPEGGRRAVAQLVAADDGADLHREGPEGR